jgi:hypothetical protein
MKIPITYEPSYSKPIWYFDNLNHVICVWDWRSL